MRTREGGRTVDEAAVTARVRAGEPEADAEDVVQQAFVKAYCALGRFRDGMAFRPWLLSIVADESRNTVRAGHAAARYMTGPPRGASSRTGLPQPRSISG